MLLHFHPLCIRIRAQPKPLYVSRLSNNEGRPLKFMDLNGKPLSFKTDARPYRRCLVFQARYAFKQAVTDGRITEQDLATLRPYLLSMSPEASNMEVMAGCCERQAISLCMNGACLLTTWDGYCCCTRPLAWISNALICHLRGALPIQLFWATMPGEGPPPPPEQGYVEDTWYDNALDNSSDE